MDTAVGPSLASQARDVAQVGRVGIFLLGLEPTHLGPIGFSRPYLFYEEDLMILHHGRRIKAKDVRAWRPSQSRHRSGLIMGFVLIRVRSILKKNSSFFTSKFNGSMMIQSGQKFLDPSAVSPHQARLPCLFFLLCTIDLPSAPSNNQACTMHTKQTGKKEKKEKLCQTYPLS